MVRRKHNEAMDARRREPPDDRSGPIGFEEELQFTGPEISDELIEQAEATLGVSLPASYRELLRVRNGGIPVRRCYPTTFPTSWTDDHFEIEATLVGGPWGRPRIWLRSGATRRSAS